ncbi:alkene reductase [Corynebacterium pacaense]|uniref:alkene reductase n=1 Tax=Corynebacterium pacaense TaxID=1816684 RepID=UPI0009BBF405|nr:alkene reductase [Corynebacterium pacaense]
MSTRIFDTFILGNRQLGNRITMAALTRQRAGEDGVPTELHAEYYSQRAGAGLIVTEGTFPAFGNRAFPGQAGIANEEQQRGWSGVAEAVHRRGGVVFMQIMHGGRVSAPDLLRGGIPEAPSAIAAGIEVHGWEGKKFQAPVPRALDTAELPRIVDEFVAAARRAVDAGLDGVEIHGANGYLLHEFLAPTSNHRDDAYGGSPENRARLLIEVIRAVAGEIGAQRTAVRISPQHNVQGTVEPDEQDVIATYGALFSGIRDLTPAYISVLKLDPADRVGRFLRDGIQRELGIPLILNTGFPTVTGYDDARHLVDDLGADAVAVGRLFISNPDLVERWATGAELNPPDASTFYSGGAHGYTDYPELARDRS